MHPILLSLSIRLLQVTAAISPPAAKGASKGRFSACIRSEGPTDFRERVSRPIWPSKLGLSTGYRLEIRDYALESAGGSSEPKASYRLLISAFSIVPDFLVFAAPSPGAEATHTPVLNTSSTHPLHCFRTFYSDSGSPTNTDLIIRCPVLSSPLRLSRIRRCSHLPHSCL